MPYDTLIQAGELLALQRQGAKLALFDCSFDLMKPEAGEQQYLQGHIPGARFAHMDRDLSDKSGQGASGGRHPLPQREAFARWAAAQGLDDDTQVVVYDRNGCNYCGRLWWMLQWCGHASTAVLDGGWQAWQAAGGAPEQGPAQPPRASGGFTLRPPKLTLVTANEVAQRIGRPGQTLVDARATPRYRGEVEPLDPVAGHIPGALNRPFGANIAADGRFKPAAELRAEFAALLGGRSPQSVVHHCGSGVSAVPNVLAMRIAGLGDSGLFAGSWSEWCADPARPVARG